MKIPNIAKALPTAKTAAPALKKAAAPAAVPKAPAAPAVSKMTIEPAANGGFVSNSEVSRKPGTVGGAWEERQELKGQHGSNAALHAHIDKVFPPKKKSPEKAASQPAAWSGIASKMLGKI